MFFQAFQGVKVFVVVKNFKRSVERKERRKEEEDATISKEK